MVRVYTPNKSESSIRKALILLEAIKSTCENENLKKQVLQIRELLNKAISEL